MKKYGITFLLWLLLFPFTNAQNYVWAHGEGGSGNDAANAVTTDEENNVYITGNLAGVAEFSGTMYQGRGVYEIFIAKYSSQGNLLWVKTAGGAENDQGNAIRYNKNFLYLTGFFSDTAWFENTMLLSKGAADMFVAKYDLNGNLVWVRPAGGTNTDFGTSIDVDNGGNVYVAGSYKTAIRFDTLQLSTNNIYNESFFVKYDNSGNLLWAKTSTGTNTNLLSGVASDHFNGVYLTGYFGGNFTIGSTTVSSLSPSTDIVLVKINADGDVIWMKRAGSEFEDAAQSVCSDNEGNAIVTGYFSGTASFGNNTVTYHDYNDVFVARYNASGDNLWVRAGKGQQLDVGFSVAADPDGNIFAAGMFQRLIVFDGNTLTAHDRDVFIVSYDKFGNIRWLTKAGEADTDCALGVAVAANGKVAVTGYYRLLADFGTIRLDYAQFNDLFVALYDPPVVNSVAEFANADVILYPNPVGDVLFITQNSGANYVLRLYDMAGCVVREQHLTEPTTGLSTAKLSEGVYLVLIETRGAILRKKLVIAR